MACNLDEVNKAIFPIRSYDELCHRLEMSLGYRFIRTAYNFTLPELEIYTNKLLGGDPRGRYSIYNSQLKGCLTRLHNAGVNDLFDLKERTASCAHLELLEAQSGVNAPEIAMLLKYLVYWVVPGEKYLSSLVSNDPASFEAIHALRETGFHTNLELLQEGITPAGRKILVNKSRLPPSSINDLVNRADFSRLPWSSKATISNIIGAGYRSLKALANADIEQLVGDFYAYGKRIGKNLKLGNEIESSCRIAKILPLILKES